MKKLLTFSLLTLGLYATASAQTPYTLLGHSYTQNFNSIGGGLPAGWQVYTNAWFDTAGTPAAFNASATAWDQGTGTFGNYAAKDTFYATATAAAQNASLNRALGAKLGTANDTGTSFVFRAANTRGLSDINFSCNIQSLDLNAARQKRWYVSYALGSNPTSFSPISGGYTTGNNTFTQTNISVNLPGSAEDQDSVLWIRVSSFFPASGSLVYPTVAIDDVNITWVGKPPVTVTYDSTNVPCYAGLTGAIDNIVAAGGTPPYTYALDSVAPNAPVFSNTTSYNGLPAGTHYIYVKDSDGTITSFPVMLTEPATPVSLFAYESRWVTCYGGGDGQAVAVTSGGVSPYQYSWDNAPYGGFKTDPDSLGILPAGVHVVHVKDTNGCVMAYNVTIDQPDSLTIDIYTEDLTCWNDSSGYMEISNIYGGTCCYTYKWSTGDSVNYYQDNLDAGNYSITVTDYNGCVKTQPITITQPDRLQLGITSTTNATNGCNGSATVAATGGTPGYFYFWSTGSFFTTISNLCPEQLYICTITDSRGCTDKDTVIIHMATAVNNVTTNVDEITVHPNPVSDVLMIDAGQPVNIRITDVTGKVLITAENTNQVRVSELANGMYIVNILDKEGRLLDNKKIMKQ